MSFFNAADLTSVVLLAHCIRHLLVNQLAVDSHDLPQGVDQVVDLLAKALQFWGSDDTKRLSNQWTSFMGTDEVATMRATPEPFQKKRWQVRVSLLTSDLRRFYVFLTVAAVDQHDWLLSLMQAS